MSETPAPTEARQQFTLRQLFLLMTAIAFWLGLTVWFGEIGFICGGILASAAAAYFRWARRSEVVVLLGITLVLIFLALPEVQVSRISTRKDYCRSRLRQIGVALDLYTTDHKGRFPSLITYSDTGRPLHSWRTHLLPGIERRDLFEQYNWNEPWNGPLNSQVNSAEIPTFQCPSIPNGASTATSYLAIEVPGYQPGDRFAVIEVPSSSVGFFEPKDITLNELLAQKPPPGVHGAKAQQLHVLWPNGEVELIRSDQLAKRLAKLQPPQSSQPSTSTAKK